MLENLKRKLTQFMQGRYGSDDLNRFLMYFILGLIIVNLFAKNTLFNMLTLALIIYLYFRMLSRNISKRYSENQWFLEKTAGVRAWFQKTWRNLSQLKDYHVYKCPGCGQKIRVPRGKGRIAIRCPKCGHEFIKNS